VSSVPPEYLPRTKDSATGAEVKAEVFRTRERVVGQVPRERILKNELIRPERLADGHAGVGLNAVVARGMRAISVDLRGADAVTGFLTPGNYVDVLVTIEDAAGMEHTEALLQSVFVLGVNSRAENETDEEVARRGKQKPAVTFMVTPEQAEQIAYASELGDLSLALRNVQDVIYNAIPAADVDAVLSRVKPKAVEEVAAIIRSPMARPAAPAPVAAAPAPTDNGPVIDIIRGGIRFRASPDNLSQVPLKGDNYNTNGNKKQ
jgi:pilus assembly protein CpaB